MRSNETAAIIPCLNEADGITAVVDGALKHVAAVWVIDDGSVDNTQHAAKKAGAVVIRHEVNLGKGASLRDGFTAARAAGFRWAIALDGDGQHDPNVIPKFYAAAQRGADLVIGNRMAECGAMPAIRRFVNRWMSRQLEKRLKISCPDTQCGFRLVSLDAWAVVKLNQDRYEVESEMLVAFARAGFQIESVPVRCLSAKRPSRIHPVADTIRWFRWWLTLPRK